jgi:hypothetical protein
MNPTRPDKRIPTALPLLAYGLLLLGGPLSCNCPQDECFTPKQSFADCVYPNNPQENTNKKYIVFGPSSAAGGWCYEKDGMLKCGFIQRLEELTGEQIANFSLAALTVSDQVENGYAWLDESLSNNPDAERVYLIMGGVDLVHHVFDHPEEAPRPSTDCQIDPEATLLTDTVDMVRLLVLHYKENGIQDVIVGSFPPVEELADHPLSCKSAAESHGADPLWRVNECFNEVLEEFSFLLYAMVLDLGGPAAGIHFADHFHGFPADPSECSFFCDCGHLNCAGHDLIAEIFYNAEP